MSWFKSAAGSAKPTLLALLALAALALALAFGADALSGILTRRIVDSCKGVVAGAAAALLFFGAWLGWSGRPDAYQRTRDSLLVALGIAAALCWWNLLQLHYPHYVHFSDTFHYYIGSKYFSELGYERLYACTAIADAEAGPHTGVANRILRDLDTNRLEPTTRTLADPERCKGRFTPERWEMFTRDVAWFRERVVISHWHRMQRDHGYNPPPSWGIFGTGLANLGPASDRQILALTLIDPLLLALMWASVGWAFGWQALCVALVYWGTNHFGVFGWNGGAFLRQGWLVTAIVGICCLRRGKPATAGFLLGCSALLRVFPVAILAAIGLKALAGMWRARRFRLTPDHRRILLGVLLAVAVILPVSLLTYGAGRPWLEFIENSRVHLDTPLKNHMGLRTLLAYDAESVDRRIHADTPIERNEIWNSARREHFAERAGIYWILVIGFILLLGLAAERQQDWTAAVLGIGLIPIAFELTNYYYAILLGFAFLVVQREIVGAALCAVAALSWAIVERWQWQDEIFTWCSAMVIVLVLFITLQMLWDEDASRTSEF